MPEHSNAIDSVAALPYNRAGLALRYEIAWLQHRADPLVSPPPADPLIPEHDPALDALSFYLRAEQRLVAYAAVVQITISHAGQHWQVAGLSCVATDPAYQRRGLGTRVVAAATRAMLDSTADIGLFTCDPPLAHFYARAADWQVVPHVLVFGSRDPAALRSDLLGKVVLMKFVSVRAQGLAAAFEHATIDLGLPVGQFL